MTRLPLDRAPLRVVPVLTRVDKDEYDEQQRWTQRLLSEASRFVGDWDPEEDPPADVLAHLVVPYVPYWSYGERLAAMRNERVSSLSVGRAHETLAALLARGLSEATLLRLYRESYVAGAAVGESAATTLAAAVDYDLYISYPESSQETARDLAAALRQRGVNLFFDQWALQPGDVWADVLGDAQRRSRMFVVLLDKGVGLTQKREIEAMVARALSGQARLVPVALRTINDLPESVRPFHGIVAPRLHSKVVEMIEVDIEALAETLLPLALRR